MNKFLRTIMKHDGISQKVIIKVNDCSRCPLFHLNKDNYTASCNAWNNNGDNVIDPFVINFDNNGKVNDIIPIPTWCGLEASKTALIYSNKTYVVLNGKMLINKSGSEIDIPFIDTTLKKYKDVDSTGDLLPSLIVANYLKDRGETLETLDTLEYDDVIYDSEMGFPKSDHSRYKPQYKPQPIIHNKCSLCLEPHESVDRSVNYGICSVCWGDGSLSGDTLTKAYINNFRIKRGAFYKGNTQNIKLSNNVL